MSHLPHIVSRQLVRRNFALLALFGLAVFVADAVIGFLGPVGAFLGIAVILAGLISVFGLGVAIRKPEGQSWPRFVGSFAFHQTRLWLGMVVGYGLVVLAVEYYARLSG